MNEQDLINAIDGILEEADTDLSIITADYLDAYLQNCNIDLRIEVIHLLVKIIETWNQVKDSSLFRAESSFSYEYLTHPIELVAEIVNTETLK